MKPYRTIIAIVTGFVLALAGAGAAGAGQWQVDPAHAGIYFGIDHIYSETRGFFEEFEAEIVFDPAEPAASRFKFSVPVKSINTRIAKRDTHLLSGDFFDARKYPAMTFESTAVSHKEGSTYSVQGKLTVKDVSRDITVPFTFLGVQPHPMNPKQEVAGFEARMTIDRLAYNVGNGKFYKMGVVGKDVEVLISIEATRDK